MVKITLDDTFELLDGYVYHHKAWALGYVWVR